MAYPKVFHHFVDNRLYGNDGLALRLHDPVNVAAVPKLPRFRLKPSLRRRSCFLKLANCGQNREKAQLKHYSRFFAASSSNADSTMRVSNVGWSTSVIDHYYRVMKKESNGNRARSKLQKMNHAL
jgi:hypothetical protein